MILSTMVKADGTSTCTLRETADLLLDTFFPRLDDGHTFEMHRPLTEYGKPVDANLENEPEESSRNRWHHG